MSNLTDGLIVHPATERELAAYVTRPVHAVLLAGHVGLGKTILAARLAAKVLQVEAGNLGDYPYFKILTKEKQGIPIEQVRELHEFFARKVPGTQSVKRAVIIPDADELTVPAQNALLKLLEEPPEDSIFILTSSRTRGLLPTVRSRLQLVDVHAPDEGAIVSYFSEKHDEADIRRTMLQTGLNITQLSARLNSTTDNQVLAEVKKVLSGTAYDRLLLFGIIAQDKAGTQTFVEALGEVVAATIRSTAAKGSSLERWQQMQAATYEASVALRKNGNAKLVMTELALAL